MISSCVSTSHAHASAQAAAAAEAAEAAAEDHTDPAAAILTAAAEEDDNAKTNEESCSPLVFLYMHPAKGQNVFGKNCGGVLSLLDFFCSIW